MSRHRLIGNVHDRRRREAWLISTFGSTNGKWVFCHHCGTRMMSRTPRGYRRWQIDRWPKCGHMGGRYTRDNIVISCAPCNRKRCAKFCGVGAVAKHASSITWEGSRPVVNGQEEKAA